VLRLVRGDMIVDGHVRPFLEVAADPILSALVSSEGPLRVTRLPGVPKTAIAVPSPSMPPPPPPGELVAFRELTKGMRGPDVAAWQRQLLVDGHSLGPWKDDGVFGTATFNATRVWQTLRGLPANGIVDAATRAAAGTPPAPAKESIDPISFVAARNFTTANRTAVDWIVMHTMEADEAAGTAENVAQWFAGPSAPRASAHYCVDVDSVVQCVRDEDVAWHAPGANAKGIGIELAGYARQSLEEWLDPYSTRLLKRAALMAARLARKWNVPTTFVDRNALLRGARGITTHNEVTWAFRKSTHTDPGPHFPMDAFLAWVKLA
jgi:N-acetyl-anhydromuramyl-L-alanine amidase AmpD